MKRRTAAMTAGMALITLCLTGCGSSSGSSATAADDSGPVKGTIEVWAMGTEGELLPKLADDFEKANPGTTVNVTAIPWDSADQKITTAITSGVGPDVVQVGTTDMAEYANMGGFAQVPDDVDSASFFPGAWDTTKLNDTAYAVPWYVDTRVLYYRTDLASKAGLSAPKTWADLTDFAAGLQQAGAKYGIELQTNGQDITNMWLPFFWQAGGSIMSSDGKTFTMDTDACAKSIDYYASFMKNGTAPQNSDDDTKLQDFVNGSLGAFVSGPWDVANIHSTAGDNSDIDSKFTVAPLPSDAKSASFIGGGDLAVMKDSKNPSTAWAFVKYLTQPDVQAKWYTLSGDLPAVQSAWNQDSLKGDPRLSVFDQVLKTAQAPPAIPTWTQISAKFDSILEKAIAGQIDGKMAAQQMQDAATSIGTGLK